MLMQVRQHQVASWTNKRTKEITIFKTSATEKPESLPTLAEEHMKP